ncbi:AbrB/MazE/SpoVT family DNA-binding domain-containing protein [Eubacteriales bacterium OttesenSCG-928-M02]|nr:AbrB/MazE/SpoVT family DNA-binding domain-containing protein [Eubacteriales bacterium OttesenSCG-928-M02]
MRIPEGYGAWMVKVGERGQIVIPKEAREMFGISPGENLLLIGDLERGLALVMGDTMAEMTQHIFGRMGESPGGKETE